MRPCRRTSWAKQRLDRSSLIHGLVSLGGPVERQLEVEYLARVDLALPDQVDQLGEEAPHRGRPPVQMHEAPEQVHPINRDAVADANETDVSSRTGGLN